MFSTRDDVQNYDDVVDRSINDGGFILSTYGDVFFGSYHKDIILEFQSELNIGDEDYDSVLMGGEDGEFSAAEKVVNKLLRRGDVYIRLWDDSWIILVYNMREKQRSAIRDWATGMMRGGADKMTTVTIEDTRTGTSRDMRMVNLRSKVDESAFGTLRRFFFAK
jgi:hypothetical protein